MTARTPQDILAECRACTIEAASTVRLVGQAAIDYAAENGCLLCKYADPTEDDVDDLTVEQAQKVAAEDQSLVYIDVASESA